MYLVLIYQWILIEIKIFRYFDWSSCADNSFLTRYYHGKYVHYVLLIGLQLIAGSTDSRIVNSDKNFNFADGWLVLSMYASRYYTDTRGALTLDYNSDLYNAVKYKPTFQNKLFGTGYMEQTEYSGEIVRYGVSPETMAKMLKVPSWVL